jgi:hypothetical protein
VVEVYPSLWARSFAREERTDDQHDAYSIAAWMREADGHDLLNRHFNPALSADQRKVANIEGWILGVG